MASSFNQKSNSSASSKPKPTFRRAGASAPRPARAKSPASGPAPARPASVPAPKKAISAYSAPAKKRPALKAAPQPQKPAGPRPAPRGGKLPSRSVAPRPRTAAAAKPAVKKLKSMPAPQRAADASAKGPSASKIFSRVALPGLSGKIALGVAGVAAAILLVALIIFNSGLFAATDVWIQGSEHVTKDAAEQLIDLPEGTTLFSIDEDAISQRLMQNPWVSGVEVERVFPHTLIIKPRERAVEAVVYIAADDIAWAIGDDGCWIAPISLSVAEGAADAQEPADDAADDAAGAATDDAAQAAPEAGGQAGLEAAQAAASELGALLFTDVSSGVSPVSGKPVESDVILAGLKYAKGFSPEFISQIKFISLPSEEAIAANLTSGVEVALGTPDNIKTKEQVITKLLEQEQGVTYIDVRVPNSYTFRSLPV